MRAPREPTQRRIQHVHKAALEVLTRCQVVAYGRPGQVSIALTELPETLRRLQDQVAQALAALASEGIR